MGCGIIDASTYTKANGIPKEVGVPAAYPK